MPKRNSMAKKSETSRSSDSKPTASEPKKQLKTDTPSRKAGEGVLVITCPCCGQRFRFRRGKVKNPEPKEIDKYFLKAQCPYCGQKLRIKKK